MELFSFLQVDSDLTAWFILDGQEYEMSHFDIISRNLSTIKGNRKMKYVVVSCPLHYHKRFLKTFTDGE